MNLGSLARRYGRAFLLVAEEVGHVDRLGKEIEKIDHLFHGHPEILKTLVDNGYPVSERKHLLAELMDRLALSGETKNFLNLLVDKNRIFFFPQIAVEFRRLWDEVMGIARVEVTSATPLSKEFLKKTQEFLSRKTGKKPVIEEKINPELIGGVIFKEGGVLYDGSIRSEIGKLREQLVGAG